MTDFSAHQTTISGLYTVQLKQISDDRGVVREAYRQSDLAAAGLPSLGDRPQTNCTETVRGGLRGIHAEAMHKFVRLAAGAVVAAIVDLRPESPTAGDWLAFWLEPGDGLFVSAGLGNAFQSVSDQPSQYLYDFSLEWAPGLPGQAVHPLDPDLDIPWPIKVGLGMIVSAKDLANPSLKEVLGR